MSNEVDRLASRLARMLMLIEQGDAQIVIEERPVSDAHPHLGSTKRITFEETDKGRVRRR